MAEPKYKRVLLKLSGEALAGEKSFGVDVETVGAICDKVKEVIQMGVEVAIVVGGVTFGEEETDIKWKEQQQTIWEC